MVEYGVLYNIGQCEGPTKISSRITYLFEKDRFLSDPTNYEVEKALGAIRIALTAISDARASF